MGIFRGIHWNHLFMGMLEESNNGASHPKSLYFSPSRRGVGAPVASRYDPRSSASKCKDIRQGSHREVICLQLLALKNPKNLVKAMNTEKEHFGDTDQTGSQSSKCMSRLELISQHGRAPLQVFISCFDKAFISYKTSC